VQKLHEKKCQVDEFNQSVTRKSMIRYLTIIVDFSRASLKLDLRPNRAMVTKELLSQFLQEFTDQNPLSKLSIIATMKERAIVISDFQENITTILQRLKEIDDFEGNPSYQNALEIAKT